MKIAINGAGIAGTTLAYWLCKFGHEVLLIEKAPELRSGGYIIDFWGIGYDVAKKMNIIPQLQDMQYHADRLHLVGRHGQRRGGYDVDILSQLTNGRFLALSRSDLAATIYAAVGDQAETIFGDSITKIKNEGDNVRVDFEHETPRDVDIVVGADGLHSNVRDLVFGEKTNFEFSLDCHFAVCEVSGYQPSDDLKYVAHGAPGKYVTRFTINAEKTFFFFVFRDKLFKGDISSRELEYQSVLKEVFGDMGWECPQILSAMDKVDDIYFDSVSQIRMDHWTRGRTALVGDAAACPSLLAGEGAGLAVAEAYVLAGELHNNQDDYRKAFGSYEKLMIPFLRHKQKSAEKLLFSFVPKSSLGVFVRDFGTRLMKFPFFAQLFMGRHMQDDIELPNYEN